LGVRGVAQRFEAATESLQNIMDGFMVGLCIFEECVRVELGVFAEAVEIVEVWVSATLLEIVQPLNDTLVPS
jgi:hypothetical protein